MMVGLVILILALIGYAEGRPLVKERQWPELIATEVLVLVGLGLGVSSALGVQLPNPVMAIEFLTQKAVSIVGGLLGGGGG